MLVYPNFCYIIAIGRQTCFYCMCLKYSYLIGGIYFGPEYSFVEPLAAANIPPSLLSSCAVDIDEAIC
jgi:hypothetical protein